MQEWCIALSLAVIMSWKKIVTLIQNNVPCLDFMNLVLIKMRTSMVQNNHLDLFFSPTEKPVM